MTKTKFDFEMTQSHHHNTFFYMLSSAAMYIFICKNSGFALIKASAYSFKRFTSRLLKLSFYYLELMSCLISFER